MSSTGDPENVLPAFDVHCLSHRFGAIIQHGQFIDAGSVNGK
jgi:hypothetical protein